MHKNFLCLKDCSADELNYLLRRAIKLKSRVKAGEVYRPFEGKVLAMLFEKASTRTRVSFEAGMAQLGGTSIYLNTAETSKMKSPLRIQPGPYPAWLTSS